MRTLLKFYHQLRNYKVDQPESQVQLFNYLSNPAKQDFWLRDFIESRQLLAETNKRVAVFSVFGSKMMMRLNRADIKIFVARENLHRSNWKEYNNLCEDIKSLDLRLGFDYEDSDNYMRFPLWIMWNFPADVTYEQIKSWCDRVNNPVNMSYKNRRFCSFLCSHADLGRAEIYEQISQVDRVDCDGRLFHNNDDLKTKYNDDKVAYLRQYRFNLTPENSEAPGYVTEKLFEAISAGCIPIYSGSGNCPEPDVLNQDAILFIKMFEGMSKDENKETIEKLRHLNEDEEAYLAYAHQHRLKPEAADIIWNYIEELERRLKDIIREK